ncbi:MAG: tRNA (cytidine(34)-2'-O)-methyltransferase [Firmicutes bacterium]|nr:tRNA (cytidine(34)-2'-O)-methyltransferase [Bacillota bacterium]
MLNIVLVEPEIPQNTGNIARTCACTGTALHLVKPFKFEISDKTVKRAGLDYWDKLNLTIYDSWQDFLQKNSSAPLYYIETTAKKNYAEINYPQNAFLVFGQETKGLKLELIEQNPDTSVFIPMNGKVRSLNVSNAVAIVLYEALRQHNFAF